MRAGSLRERVRLLREAPASDPAWGGAAPPPRYAKAGTAVAWDGWTCYATAWAWVRGLRGTERPADKGTQGATYYEARVRYNADTAGINARDRLAWGDRVLDVLSAVDPDGRREEVVIEAVEYPQRGA